MLPTTGGLKDISALKSTPTPVAVGMRGIGVIVGLMVVIAKKGLTK